MTPLKWALSYKNKYKDDPPQIIHELCHTKTGLIQWTINDKQNFVWSALYSCKKKKKFYTLKFANTFFPRWVKKCNYIQNIYHDSQNSLRKEQAANTHPTPKQKGGHSHWRQYTYARTARVPFWPISVPQRVGFSSNVPLRVGFLTPNMCQ